MNSLRKDSTIDTVRPRNIVGGAACAREPQLQLMGFSSALDLQLSRSGATRPSDAVRFAANNPIECLGGVRLDERELLNRSPQHVRGGHFYLGRRALLHMPRHSFDTCQVHVVIGWINRVLVRRHKRHNLDQYPIVTRVYQAMTDGNMFFATALKISDTPFPFPYASRSTVYLMISARFT
jgi:hypothetical protein